MLSKIKSIISVLSISVLLYASPPVLNVYVIPFDNINNDVAIGWLTDAYSEMVNAELSKSARIYLKDK